jgi:hypothetical protein
MRRASEPIAMVLLAAGLVLAAAWATRDPDVLGLIPAAVALTCLRLGRYPGERALASAIAGDPRCRMPRVAPGPARGPRRPTRHRRLDGGSLRCGFAWRPPPVAA